MKNIAILAILAVSASAAAHAAEVDIDQAGQKFSPDKVTVKSGDTMHFTNEDDVKHNIHVDDESGNSQDMGIQKPGETINKTFDRPGHYQIHCSIHPRMKMTVDVQ